MDDRSVDPAVTQTPARAKRPLPPIPTAKAQPAPPTPDAHAGPPPPTDAPPPLPTPKVTRPKPDSPLKNVDLSDPRPWGYSDDREGNPMPRDRGPRAVRPEARPNAIAAGLNGAVEASAIADKVARNDPGAIPQGWTKVDHPDLKDEMRKAGAVHLVSPEGLHYMAFSEEHAKKSVRENIVQAFGASTERTSAAAKIGFALAQDHDITYAGSGKGGALAKLAAEAASTYAPGDTDTRPKVCVAINSTAVPPGAYRDNDLATKGHARTTVNLVNEFDARMRLSGFVESKGYDARDTGGAGDTVVMHKGRTGVVVGGPRDGEARTGTTYGNVTEPKAYTDQAITFEGKIGFETRGEVANLRKISGDVGDDFLRKALLGASRDPALKDHLDKNFYART
jgi:hypothetical protein